MTLDLSSVSYWIWIIIALGIVFVILQFFLHIVQGVVHVVTHFFWHGCSIAIVLLVLYFVLRGLHVL